MIKNQGVFLEVLIYLRNLQKKNLKKIVNFFLQIGLVVKDQMYQDIIFQKKTLYIDTPCNSKLFIFFLLFFFFNLKLFFIISLYNIYITVSNTVWQGQDDDSDSLPYFPTTLALRLYRLYHRHGGYVASRGTVLHPPDTPWNISNEEKNMYV